MSSQNGQIYEFGDFRLIPAEHLLRRREGGETLPLHPKAFETLLLLVRNHGRVVSKDEITEQVWADTFVSDGSLTVNISLLRKVLGEKGSTQKYIETVPKVGYRFVADVSVVPNAGANGNSTSAEQQPHTPAFSSESSHLQVEASPQSTELVVNQTAIAAVQKDKTGHFSKQTWVALGAIIIAAITVAFATYKLSTRSANKTDALFQRMQIGRLTDDGNTVYAAISPDAARVANIEEDEGRQGLFVRELATGTNKQIVPPAEVEY